MLDNFGAKQNLYFYFACSLPKDKILKLIKKVFSKSTVAGLI